jgi:hypothetical protein
MIVAAVQHAGQTHGRKNTHHAKDTYDHQTVTLQTFETKLSAQITTFEWRHSSTATLTCHNNGLEITEVCW